jgi:hypothetical protein
MKIVKLTFLLAMLIVAISCEEDETNEFTNKLTFGTSINYTNFTLNGEGTSFSTNPGNVAYRLESEEDFDSNAVKFVIKKDGFTYSTEVFASNPVPVGHIFMTTLNYGQAGTYSVEAFIEKAGGDKFVASGTFQMN